MTTIDDIAARQDLAPTVVPERYLMSAPPFTPTPGPEVELAKLRADVDRLTAALADAESCANAASDLFRAWVKSEEPRPTRCAEWPILSKAVADYDYSRRSLALSPEDGKQEPQT